MLPSSLHHYYIFSEHKPRLPDNSIVHRRMSSGFGVITSTSSRMRSSQSWIFFGFPFRTRNTIVDVYGALSSGSSSFHPLWSCRHFRLLNIIIKCKCHYICLQAVDHFQCLFTGASMWLDHINILSCFFFPVFLKNLIIGLVKFSCRIIRNIDDMYVWTCTGIVGTDAGKYSYSKYCTRQMFLNFFFIIYSTPVGWLFR